jgi:membrane associated rhomboid family serine protease
MAYNAPHFSNVAVDLRRGSTQEVDDVGGLIPLSDASRRPVHVPVMTILIIVVNALVFVLELLNGESFVIKWSAVPADIVTGHHLITIFTAMFMHGGWSHIIGNMIFLWAFGPEIEDAMGRWRYLIFYLVGGMVAMTAQIIASPHSTVPNLGASGAIAAVMGAFIITYPRDRIRSVLFILIFIKTTRIPAALLIGFWFLTQLLNAGAVARVQTGGVAYLAHIGGFIYGAVTARLFEDPSRIALQETSDL